MSYITAVHCSVLCLQTTYDNLHEPTLERLGLSLETGALRKTQCWDPLTQGQISNHLAPGGHPTKRSRGCACRFQLERHPSQFKSKRKLTKYRLKGKNTFLPSAPLDATCAPEVPWRTQMKPGNPVSDTMP